MENRECVVSQRKNGKACKVTSFYLFARYFPGINLFQPPALPFNAQFICFSEVRDDDGRMDGTMGIKGNFQQNSNKCLNCMLVLLLDHEYAGNKEKKTHKKKDKKEKVTQGWA